ncbi:protein SPT2 homolog [Arvicola amphibius]|uniref:protein SPT2 homolog n=1 Tax=Arvicola amphibius TaxID=1047088 RepID=UPI0018E39242|nr:protein SPT2 homolog [Arvicola amphibius]
MDFREILLIASKGQGVNHVPKRYSLAVGPPKKDSKVKGVQPATVQAFLRRKEEELKRTALEEKRKREELVRKRIELKHYRRARAMARRTKDNFHGYDGIPVKKKTKKRQRAESRPNQGTDPEFEVEAGNRLGELEQEFKEDQEPLKDESQPKAPLKRAPPPMTFTDLMRLAEKKQLEPVGKAVRKAEDRPLTAKELREREFLERTHKNKKPETEAKLPLPVSPSHRDSVGTKPSKGSGDRQPSSKGLLFPNSEKTSKPSTSNEKRVALSSCKSTPGERIKAGSGSSSQSSNNRPISHGAGKPQPSTSSPSVPKTSASGTQKSASEQKARKPLPSHPSHSKPGPTVFPYNEAKSPGIRQPGSNSDSTSGRPSPGTARPTVSSGAMPMRQHGSSCSGPEQPISGIRKLASHPHPSGRPVNSTHGPGQPASSSTGPGRPISGPSGSGRPSSSSGGPRQPVNSPHDIRRPVSSLGLPGRSVSGPGRSISDVGDGSVPAGQTVSSGPGRPVSSLGPGRTVSSPGLPVKPKCTVVSETISSKNIISQSSNGQINGMKPLPPGYKSVPGPQRLAFPTGYKRLRECKEENDDDYDPDMDDFIEDEGDPQEEISKHIREIFGYDRRKYKDESDYALRYMESSWQEQQEEEAKSLRLGKQEDFQEMRREEEEGKRGKAKKLKLPEVTSC